MLNVIDGKTFLDSKDICSIFGCCKTKSYGIINSLNLQLEKEGKSTFKGKVLAIALFDRYGMTDNLERHNEFFKIQKMKG